jgi:hypothetical protein
MLDSSHQGHRAVYPILADMMGEASAYCHLCVFYIHMWQHLLVFQMVFMVMAVFLHVLACVLVVVVVMIMSIG